MTTMPSPEKHLLHWRGPSLAAALLLLLPHTLESEPNCVLPANQGSIIMHYQHPVEMRAQGRGKAKQQEGFIIVCRRTVFSIWQKNALQIPSITCGLC